MTLYSYTLYSFGRDRLSGEMTSSKHLLCTCMSHLSCLSAASLTHQYHCLKLLNQVKDVITMLCVQRSMYIATCM